MTRLRRQIFSLIEGWGRTDRLGRLVDAGLVALILVNVVAVTAETLAGVGARHAALFDAIEAVSVAVFTVEYLVRLWVAVEDPDTRGRPAWRVRLRYALRPMALIDLAAILPSYLAALGLAPGLDGRVLRAVRMLRVLKLTRYSVAMQSIGAVFRNERRTLVAALVTVVIAVQLSATAIYLVEHTAQPQAFASIPQAMWWTLATLTTVGYGDVVPVTTAGRVIGGLVMVAGIGLFVLWTSVFASCFVDELRRSDFRVSWEMVSHVPAFAGLDAVHVGEIARLLQPLVVPGRHMILRVGERAETMYFIVSGEVEVELATDPVRLGPGDFFGEVGILHGRIAPATVVALSETRLLVLDETRFRELMDAHPELRRTITAAAAARRRAWFGAAAGEAGADGAGTAGRAGDAGA